MLFPLLVVRLALHSFVPSVEVAEDEFDVAGIALTFLAISLLHARYLAFRETYRYYCYVRCWIKG
jgi:hypothetical protein